MIANESYPQYYVRHKMSVYSVEEIQDILVSQFYDNHNLLSVTCFKGTLF